MSGPHYCVSAVARRAATAQNGRAGSEMTTALTGRVKSQRVSVETVLYLGDRSHVTAVLVVRYGTA